MPASHRSSARLTIFAAVCSFVVQFFAPTVAAQEPKAGWDAGIDVTLEGSAGLRGGATHGQALHSLALATLTWEQAHNADRTVHFRTYASVLNLAGRGPTERYLGDFLAASNTEGFASTRLYSWWGELQAGEWSVRVGALLADDEFTGTAVGGNFFNSTFGWPAFISANTVNTGPAFFAAAPGLRVARGFGDQAAWRLGVYDGDTFDSSSGDPAATGNGLHYRLGGEQGWFAISEVTYAPRETATTYKFGAWMHTANFADVRDDCAGLRLAATGGEPRLHRRNYGFYASGERTLFGTPREPGHVAAYLRAGLSPADRNILTWSFDSGVAVTGLFPGRGSDTTALGLAHANFSPRFVARARATDPMNSPPDFEQAIELTHNAALSEHLSLQPDLQLIRHPGGSRAQRDALVFLLRLKASY
jgi:porin